MLTPPNRFSGPQVMSYDHARWGKNPDFGIWTIKNRDAGHVSTILCERPAVLRRLLTLLFPRHSCVMGLLLPSVLEETDTNLIFNLISSPFFALRLASLRRAYQPQDTSQSGEFELRQGPRRPCPYFLRPKMICSRTVNCSA